MEREIPTPTYDTTCLPPSSRVHEDILKEF